MLPGRQQTVAASRTALLLIFYTLIGVMYAQKWPPEGIDYPDLRPWPGPDVNGQLTPQTPGLNFDKTFERRDPNLQVGDIEFLQGETDGEHFNNQLENVVIPLATIQGLRHAVSTSKNSTPLEREVGRNLSEQNTTQPATSEPEKPTMKVEKDEKILEPYTPLGLKMGPKVRRISFDDLDEETDGSNDETVHSDGRINSTCQDAGPPCCFNAVDYIACMLSNLNSTNAMELEDKKPDVTLSDIDSTMLDEEKLDKQLEIMVSAKPKIQQFRHRDGQPVVVKISNGTCKREYVLLSDTNSGLIFAVPNKNKRCEESDGPLGIDIMPKSFKREASPSRSLSMRSDVNYKIDQDGENFKYIIGLSVDRGNDEPTTGRAQSSKPNAASQKVKNSDVNSKKPKITAHNAPGKVGPKSRRNMEDVEKSSDDLTKKPFTRMPEIKLEPKSVRDPPIRKALSPEEEVEEEFTYTGEHEIKLEPKRVRDPLIKKAISTEEQDNVNSPPTTEEASSEDEAKEATKEEYKKFNEWHSHTKGRPNQFCLAFPILKSHCGEWVTPSNGSRWKRREGCFDGEEFTKQCIANRFDNTEKPQNPTFGLVICYLNGSYSANQACSIPKIKPLTSGYCREYDEGVRIPAAPEPAITTSYNPQTPEFYGNDGYAGLYSPRVQLQQDSRACTPRHSCVEPCNEYLQEPKNIHDGRLPKHNGNAQSDCPQWFIAKRLMNPPLRRRLPECIHAYTPSERAPSSLRQWCAPPPQAPHQESAGQGGAVVCKWLPECSPCLTKCAVYSLTDEPPSQKLAYTHRPTPIYCPESCETVKPWKSSKTELHCFGVAISHNVPVQPQHSHQSESRKSPQPHYVCAALANPCTGYFPSNYKQQ